VRKYPPRIPHLRFSASGGCRAKIASAAHGAGTADASQRKESFDHTTAVNRTDGSLHNDCADNPPKPNCGRHRIAEQCRTHDLHPSVG
jgi:hypothetical protein